MIDEKRKSYVHNIPAARRLRRPQTPTEQLLWEHLRDRQFGGLKFRRQHAIGRFVVDFYCHELRLAVEIDGGIHLDPERQRLDVQRQRELEAAGLTFIRIPAESISASVAAALARLATAISPSPATKESGEGAGG